MATDTTPPTVISTNSANSATSVAVDAVITATFSEAMETATLSTATFTMSNGVTGGVTYSSTTATFTPSSNLAYSTTYTATITTGVKDSAGNAMSSPYTWSFTTGAAPAISKSNFSDITVAAGLGGQTHATWSSAWRDFDLDGRPDLFETNHGPASLYRNNGDGTFTDVAATMLASLKLSDKHGSAWANIDDDMYPELMLEIGASQGTSTSNKVLLDRVGTSYVDIAVNVALLDPYGRGRTPLWTDINGDGLLDIILMNELGGIAGQSLGMRFFCHDSIGKFADCSPNNLPATVNVFALVADLYGCYRRPKVDPSIGVMPT